MAKTLPMKIDVTDVAGVRDRLRWAAETIGNLRRENERLRSALAVRPQADELRAIVTDLAHANPGVIVGWHDLVSRARAVVATSATPTGDDQSEHDEALAVVVGIAFDWAGEYGFGSPAAAREVWEAARLLRPDLEPTAPATPTGDDDA